ncbi:MAG: hypothetical protein SVS15_09790, partial [Thermodesulfobacteriota bacterium]|nr:hypothetical protein [Thermodesulfobacteriota bacterium]
METALSGEACDGCDWQAMQASGVNKNRGHKMDDKAELKKEFRAALALVIRNLREQFAKYEPAFGNGGGMPVGELHKIFYAAYPGLCPQHPGPFSIRLWRLAELNKETAKIGSAPVVFVLWDDMMDRFLFDALPDGLFKANKNKEKKSGENKGQETEAHQNTPEQSDVERDGSECGAPECGVAHQNAPRVEKSTPNAQKGSAQQMSGFIRLGRYLPDPKTAEAQMCISTRVRPETADMIEKLNALWNTTKYTTVRRILEMIDLPALF